MGYVSLLVTLMLPPIRVYVRLNVRMCSIEWWFIKISIVLMLPPIRIHVHIMCHVHIVHYNTGFGRMDKHNMYI